MHAPRAAERVVRFARMTRSDPTPSGSAPPRRSRTRVRAAVVLASLFAGVLAAEAGLRVVLAARGTPWDRESADEHVRGLASSMTAILPETHAPLPKELQGHVLHPYFGIDVESNTLELETQAQRFRDGTYDDAYVAVFVGGSVCAITVNEQHERIRAALASDPRLAGRRVEVVNQGRGAFKQPQQATLVVYLLALGWKPDVIVDVDGFNEVALAQANVESHVHPLQPMWGRWGLLTAGAADRGREIQLASACVIVQDEAREYAARVLADGRTSSALLGEFAVRHLTQLQSRWRAAQERYVEYLTADPASRAARGPHFEPEGDAAFRQYVATWTECSRSLAALCAERGITYLHVLQPCQLDPGSKPLTPEEVAVAGAPKPWITGVRAGYPLLREAGAKLAAEGLPFVDLSRVFEDFRETTYTDMCHFHGRGGERFADAIVAALRARLPAAIPARRAWARTR